MSIKSFSKSRGYTLIELTIVMIVISILVTAGLGALRIYLLDKEHQTTLQRMRVVSEKVQDFLLKNGRYPCPASLSEPLESSVYGWETECTAAATMGHEEGVYVAQGRRAVAEIDAPLTDEEKQKTPEKARVRMGAIPVRALGIADDFANDGFGNRFLYAVTENLAARTPDKFEGGAITILDERDRRELKGRGNAAMVILSHGPNQAGAYDKYGTQVLPCPEEVLESENCDYKNATFRNSLRMLGDRQAFDDYMFFSYSYASPKWQTRYNKDNDLFNENAALSTVSIGAIYLAEDLKKIMETEREKSALAPPDPLAAPALSVTEDQLPRLEIHGNMKLDENFSAEKICSEDVKDCFTTSVIAGAGMHCPEKYSYMTGIRESLTVCDDKILCEQGYMKGIAEDTGLPICGELPTACAEKPVTVCDIPYTLPSVSSHKRYVLKAGMSYVESYECEKDEWKKISGAGECACEPSEGVYQEPCESGYKGAITRNRKFVCDSETQGHWENLDVVSDTCECAPTVEIEEAPCTGGYVGKIVRERTFQCPEARWGEWRTKRDACSRSFDPR